MISILGWLIYGLVVGMLAKMIHPGEEAEGCLPTLVIGVAGSYIGGVLNWLIGNGDSPFQASGLIMGILGGVLFCFAWDRYKSKQ